MKCRCAAAQVPSEIAPAAFFLLHAAKHQMDLSVRWNDPCVDVNVDELKCRWCSPLPSLRPNTVSCACINNKASLLINLKSPPNPSSTLVSDGSRAQSRLLCCGLAPACRVGCDRRATPEGGKKQKIPARYVSLIPYHLKLPAYRRQSATENDRK